MPWITTNVLWQGPGEDLASMLDALATKASQRGAAAGLLHVLNPYKTGVPAVGAVHERTLKSIETARELAGGVRVVAVIEPGHEVPEEGFDEVVRLARPAFDDRPELFEVLAAGGNSGAAGEYVIFTNMDICVAPAFYRGIQTLLALGAEALIINRRTVHGWDPATTESALAQFDLGKSHPGIDCLVFPRAWLAGFATSSALLGHGFVMRGLLYNLVALADPLVFLTEVAMTYHYGDDRPWLDSPVAELGMRNREAAAVVFEKLAADPDIADRLDAFVAALPKYDPRPS